MPTFLFTDIEQSTRLWEQHPGEMPDVMLRHDALIRARVEGHGGQIVRHTGDGVFAAFVRGDPLGAALSIQRDVAAQRWGRLDALWVRMALHAGSAIQQAGEYFGPTVNRAHRLLEVSWGGQILLTPEVAMTCDLPDGGWLEDLGEHLLRDLSAPQRIYLLRHPDLPTRDTPPLRSLSAQPHDLPDALRTAVTYRVDSLAMYTLAGMARLLAAQGQIERAVVVLAFVLVHASTSALAAGQARALLEELRAALAADAFARAVEEGRAKSLEQIVTEVAGE